ncbi:MAG: Cys-tRNA(Pro) deacylase [Clostridia bacterium]|nr:Cys-tRNA(Pro) deacylase [Clostridia bacterium]
MEKTNVMRLLEQKKIKYTPHFYDNTMTDGESIARVLGESCECTFKTLVTEDGNRHYFVFVIPVHLALDLKKAAKTAGVKALAMLPQKNLLPLTGYIHGGCSPIGMKKKFPTYIDQSVTTIDKMFCSAGKVGAQIEVAPRDLINYTGAKTADLTKPKEA